MTLSNKPFHKTRQLLIDVMSDLLRVASIEDITIKVLVQQAGITRSTFYTYYQDKYALFEDLIDQCTRQIYYALRYVPARVTPSQVRKSLYDNIWQVLFTLYSNKHIFTQIGPDIRTRMLEKEIHAFKPVLLQQLNHLDIDPKMNKDIFAAFYLSGIISAYQHWITTDYAMPIEELCEQLTNLSMTFYTEYLTKE